MINLSGMQTKWRSLQDDLITFHSDVAHVYGHPSFTGTNFDDFFNEGNDPQSPSSGVNRTDPSAVTVTGIMYYEHGLLPSESIRYYQIGYFIPGDAMFVCKISDATVNGNNIFEGCKFVSVDGKNYLVDKVGESGLGRPYIYNVLLKKSNIGA